MASLSTRTYQRGFSLLELSIALAVIGIVVAGGLSMSTSMVDRTAYVQTGNQMDEVDKALAAFVAVNDRLPCPSNPALAIDHADFGKELPGCAGTQSATGTDGKNVRIGGLPVRSLGLRDRLSADEYGNRYTYAVTTNLTTDAETGGYRDAAEAGAISMADADIHDMAYVVVSHGGDSKGAYRYETASNTVTCAGGQDAENCNGDATFRDTRFNRGSVAGNWFDDTVRFKRKEMINLTAGAASAGTTLWAANGDDIYNTNTDNVSVGGGSSGARFTVIGADNADTMMIEGGEDATNVLNIESMLGENAIRLVTKGTTRAIWIDHVGDGGTGIDLTMNNDNSTGLRINMLGTGTGANITAQPSGEGAALMVTSQSSTDDAYAIWGVAQNNSAYNAGIVGETGSAAGVGVIGLNLAATGSNAVGVYGKSSSANGRGVYGHTTDTTGVAYGVYGESSDNSGSGVYGLAPRHGVYGRANSFSGGNTYGGYFVSDAPTSNGYGVFGSAVTYGVYGQSVASGGTGVYGRATALSGVNYAGRFVLSSSTTNAAAVRGEASGTTGNTYGGHFSNASATGTAVYGEATNTGASATSGVHGITRSTDTWATGVKGESLAATGTAMGVMGWSQSDQGIGVHGKTNGTNSTAVYGWATANSGINYGVRGSSSSTTGRGVSGTVSATSGLNYGVYGQTSSAAGYGVSGLNNNGGYGVYCNGALCGGTIAWTPASDKRLKEDITALNDAHGLDAIRKLRPVTYTWKDMDKKKLGTQIGFIAQEVEPIFPELVVPGADLEITLKNGKKETVKHTKAMAYETLTAPLVRAVQQLADKFDALFDSVKKLIAQVSAHESDIQTLKAENAALKDDNAKLKARLDAIEAKLTN